MYNSSVAMGGSPAASHSADTASFNDDFMQYCYKVRRNFVMLTFNQRSLDLHSWREACRIPTINLGLVPEACAQSDNAISI
jgi:hypothetical protein